MNIIAFLLLLSVKTGNINSYSF